jgi:hypothetical protein
MARGQREEPVEGGFLLPAKACFATLGGGCCYWQFRALLSWADGVVTTLDSAVTGCM